MDLRIISYNCNSFRSNAEIISRLLGISDVFCIQETFICRDDVAILENFDDHFYVAAEPAIRKDDTFVGRSSGGGAIFWRKPLNLKIGQIYYSLLFRNNWEILCRFTMQEVEKLGSAKIYHSVKGSPRGCSESRRLLPSVSP